MRMRGGTWIRGNCCHRFDMRGLFMHLLVTAYVAPFVGAGLYTEFYLMARSQASTQSAPFYAAIFAAFVTLWFCWFIFVPLSLCSFAFFRLTAAHHYRGWAFYLISCAVWGATSGAVFALTGRFFRRRGLESEALAVGDNWRDLRRIGGPAATFRMDQRSRRPANTTARCCGESPLTFSGLPVQLA